MKPELDEKYLITTDAWFIAPDGEQYKAVFGTVTAVNNDKEALGIKTNRGSSNWYVNIGNMIIAGCQIHYLIKTDECSNKPTTENRHGLVVPHVQRQFGTSVGHAIDAPNHTVMSQGNGKSALVTAFLTEHANGSSQRNFSVEEPLRTQCAQVKGGHFAVVTPFIAKHYGGNYTGPGIDVREPVSTVTTTDHHALVAALMAPYYGSGSGETGRSLTEPSPTVTSKDRLQLVTVNIEGESYVLTDIGMRMFAPRELYRAQGFDDNYKIDIEIDGKPLSKKAQVRMCGNSVCPPLSHALVMANFAHEESYKQQVAL